MSRRNKPDSYLTNTCTKSCLKKTAFCGMIYYTRTPVAGYTLCLASSETVSRLRPFALLDARTLRPLAVAILSRKPCLFFLFLFDG